MNHHFTTRKEILGLISTCINPQEARQLHACFQAAIRVDDTYMLNKLVEMYGRCGSLCDAGRVFDGIIHKDSFSWEIMLSALTSNKGVDAAKALFETMPQKTLVSFNIILKAIARNGDVHEALDLFHAMPQWSLITLNSIINLNAESGFLPQAKAVFDSMPFKNIVSHNALLAAYARAGETEQAKILFDSMELWNLISWSTMYRTYSLAGHLDEARIFFRDEMPVWDLATWSVLIRYSPTTDDSRRAFDAAPERDVTSYTALVSALVENGCLRDARALFLAMPEWSAIALSAAMPALAAESMDEVLRMVEDLGDPVCWSSLLLLMIDRGFVIEARQHLNRAPAMDLGCWNTILGGYAHDGAEKLPEVQQMFESMRAWDLVSWNTILSLHAQFGSIPSCEKIFGEMPQRDMVSWNSMLSAYARRGYALSTKTFFHERMPRHSPVSCSLLLGACSGVEEVKRCFDLLPHQSLPAWNAMLTVLATHGHLEQVRTTFTSLPQHDVLSWNATLSAASQCSDLFYLASQFQKIPHKNTASWNIALSAYAASGHIESAKQIFLSIPVRDSVTWNMRLSLNRGPVHAKVIFDTIPQQEVDTWNSLIGMLAAKRQMTEGMEAFRQMAAVQMPSEVTFTVLMTLSGHLGKIRECRQWLLAMESEFGMSPNRQHYCCVVDCLARAGHLDAAQDLVANMPFVPGAMEWRCMLAASTSASSVVKHVAGQLFNVDSIGGANYVLFSNLKI